MPKEFITQLIGDSNVDQVVISRHVEADRTVIRIRANVTSHVANTLDSNDTRAISIPVNRTASELGIAPDVIQTIWSAVLRYARPTIGFEEPK